METLYQNNIEFDDKIDNYLSNNEFFKKMIEDKKLEYGTRKILILIKKLYDNLSVKSEENSLNYEDLFFFYMMKIG
jgi:hypothetical protein